MKELLLRILMAAIIGGIWQSPSAEVESMGEVERLEEQTEEAVGIVGSRDVFSAYIVGGVDCMDDGTYEQYVKTFIDGKEEEARPEHQSEADGEDFPDIYFRFMGLDVTDYWTAREPEARRYRHKAFCSDGFYMEYPIDWYVGSTDACPLTFVPEWEEESSGEFIRDWAEYFDEKLGGSAEEVQTYIEGGGINGYLEEVLGKPVTKEYEFVLREKDSDWLLIYDLKRNGKEAAEIIVWCNLGKMNIRNWEVELTVDSKDDYGRIMVFQEWDTQDFSSEEAIKDYVHSDDFLYRLLGTALGEQIEAERVRFETSSFATLYHDFVCVDVNIHDADDLTQILRQATVYIPVAKSYQANWLVVFESFSGSVQKEGVSNPQVRERVMSTFVSLPYYHEVKKGENLSLIAQLYGEEPELAYEIAKYQTNHISQPDLIYPGQKIEIPLGVLFQKVYHS